MKSHDFRGVLHAQPFRPFSFSTVGGENYTVSTPEAAWNPPDGEIVAISGPDGVALLDVEEIAEIAVLPDPPGVQGRVVRIKRLMRAEPFAPFLLNLVDGRRFPVARPEGLAISPDGRTVGLFREENSFEILDVDQITDIEPGPGPSPR